MDYKYIKIKLQGGSSYIQPIDEFKDALIGELDGLSIGDTVVFEFTPVSMTEKEYNQLPEFTGH